ncbi:MAG: malonyl-CoA synthase [Sneathiella sp.]|uniref:malonate--CoA ligase n=1 Tax=Sneathiella sp. TaxID=1964365 RepID=UPI003002E270
MTNKNLYTLFEDHFPSDKSAIAFEGPDVQTFSFEQIVIRSAQMANFMTDLGAKPGDRVAVQVGKSVEAVILYLACLRAGLVYLPLNTAYKAAEIEYFVGDASPALVICDPSSLSEISKISTKAGVLEVLTLNAEGRGNLTEGAANCSFDFTTVSRASDDLAAILYTSGTTGRSKGAMLTHDNLASNALSLHKTWRFDEDDVLLHALPIFHVHGLFVALHCALLNGSKIIFLTKFDALTVTEYLPSSTVFMGVPTFYVRLLSELGLTSEICRNMRLFTAGSAPLLEETFSAFSEKTGHVILERYGMTEAGMITTNPYDGERKAGTVGFPLDNDVRITDDDGKIVPDGEIGILEIKGPNVFKGYWQMPDKTAAEFRSDGFFITGDMTRKGDDGYYRIVGRSKDLIISGGYNVYPKEIESFIDEMPTVEESAVVGRPHVDFGEAVVAFVVPTASTSGLQASDVTAFIKEKLANFKVPKQVYIVDTLPRNTMGKVQKNALRELALKDA